MIIYKFVRVVWVVALTVNAFSFRFDRFGGKEERNDRMKGNVRSIVWAR